MKYYILLLFCFYSMLVKSQDRSEDSVYNVCDTQAVRFCGLGKVAYLKVNRKKIREDIEMLKQLQKSLVNNDTLIKYTRKNRSIIDQRYYNGDTAYRRELIEGHYFRVSVDVLSIGNLVFKGFSIDHSTTLICTYDNRSIAYLFDTRLFKKYIRPALFLPYQFQCARIRVLYYNDFLFNGRVRVPTRLNK